MPLLPEDQKSVSSFIDLIYDETMGAIAMNKSTAQISIINTAINRGIVFHPSKMKQPISMWIGLLKASVRRLLDTDYRLDHGYMSNSESKKHDTSRHHVYIKPSLRLRAQVPVKQLFGNLFFDLMIEDDVAIKWQLLSNVYRGRNYQEPLDLEDLVSAMWDKM